MPEENDDQQENEEGKKETPGQLRNKLEQAIAQLGEKDTQIASLNARVLLGESGLTGLSDRQRKVIIREAMEEAGDKELTVDLLKSVAEDFGFSKAPKKDVRASDKNVSTSQTPTENNSEDDDDQEEEENPALTAMDRILQAQQRAQKPSDQQNFETLMANAKSSEEVDAIISKYGGKHGVLLESDID